MAGLPPRAMAPSVRLLARWGLSPRVDWPTARRRLALGLRFPPPPRGTQIRPVTLGGVPCEEVRPRGALDESSALVYFHGGGYVVCTPADYRGLTGLLAAAFGARVIVVDYRLAPEHPYPAALDDARAVWRAMSTELELTPERVAVAGDSAGGGLTLALALGLRDAGAPLPAALGLIAPWLDLVPDIAGTRPPDPGDVLLNRALLNRFARAYLAGGTPPDTLAVSPLHAELAGLPPTIVHTSEHDLLRPDGEAFVARAKRARLPVEHEALPELWHDPHISAQLLAEPGGGAPARLGAGLRALLG
jgi:epsilon-lactone hydrolase